MAEQPTRTTRYTVLACSLSKIHPRRVVAGSYESTAEAVACANRVIRKSISSLCQQNYQPSRTELHQLYLYHGELPLILGEPGIPFDADRALDWQIRLFTRRWQSETLAPDTPLAALLLRQILASRDGEGSPPPGYGKVWPGAGGGEVSAVDAPASASLNVSGSNATVADESAVEEMTGSVGKTGAFEAWVVGRDAAGRFLVLDPAFVGIKGADGWDFGKEPVFGDLEPWTPIKDAALERKLATEARMDWDVSPVRADTVAQAGRLDKQ